ncbi:hypothetical protein HMPREF2899_09025 [Corynebacterium sp. HMSC072D01]|uniref:hypothetical protein n=1 Tax=Corynebacterium sp. HMSC072D01 TaxID=1739403 RepID=UPI0008A8AFFD|nr:hypothetical protein [Corynebacterium sp. HMSC072D01]OHR28109.1 hypothetical protein HMPREF2899_09025 [Corynebacterium sp. HMSC072D01]
MKQRSSGMWKKTATTVVAGCTSAALLTACGSGEESNNAGGEAGKESTSKMTKADGSAPAASEDQLLLTNEVQGVDFSNNRINGYKDAMEMFSEDSLDIESAECATFIKPTEELERAVSSFANLDAEKVTIAVSVLKNPQTYQEYTDVLNKCSEVTASMDASDLVNESMEGQELPPEAQEMLNDMDMTTTMKMHREKWEPDLSVKPDELTAHATVVDISSGGTNTDATSYDIVGVVNGVMVMVSAAPIPDVPSTGAENATQPMELAQATPESKEAAKKRALEVFDAQAKKIMDAA